MFRNILVYKHPLVDKHHCVHCLGEEAGEGGGGERGKGGGRQCAMPSVPPPPSPNVI